MPRELTLYDTLHVLPTAHPGVIKAAYRCLVQEHHPDKHAGCGHASDKLVRINQAYAVLSDPVLRDRYNRTLGLPLDVQGMPLVERRGHGRPAVCARSLETKDHAVSRPFAFRPLI